jgi:hypothetical protein
MLEETPSNVPSAPKVVLAALRANGTQHVLHHSAKVPTLGRSQLLLDLIQLLHLRQGPGHIVGLKTRVRGFPA